MIRRTFGTRGGQAGKNLDMVLLSGAPRGRCGGGEARGGGRRGDSDSGVGFGKRRERARVPSPGGSAVV